MSKSKYRVYLEMPVSTVVEVEAESPENAMALAYDSPDMPAGHPGGSDAVDAAGDWMVTVVEDERGTEVWSESEAAPQCCCDPHPATTEGPVAVQAAELSRLRRKVDTLGGIVGVAVSAMRDVRTQVDRLAADVADAEAEAFGGEIDTRGGHHCGITSCAECSPEAVAETPRCCAGPGLESASHAPPPRGDESGQRTWHIPVPGSCWAETCVTSMGPVDATVQVSGAARYTPDQADGVADALRRAAADARHRFAQGSST